jgi:hypothetical protein
MPLKLYELVGTDASREGWSLHRHCEERSDEAIHIAA